MNAASLNLTASGLISAMKQPTAWEIFDDVTGEVIGTIKLRNGRYEMNACGRNWTYDSLTRCLERAAADYPAWKQVRDHDRALMVEAGDLPAELRPLWLEVQNAQSSLKIEETRNWLRQDVVDRARQRVADAEAAFADAQRVVAQAA